MVSVLTSHLICCAPPGCMTIPSAHCHPVLVASTLASARDDMHNLTTFSSVLSSADVAPLPRKLAQGFSEPADQTEAAEAWRR